MLSELSELDESLSFSISAGSFARFRKVTVVICFVVEVEFCAIHRVFVCIFVVYKWAQNFGQLSLCNGTIIKSERSKDKPFWMISFPW